MTEIHPTDDTLLALSGTADAEQEVRYPPIGESPYYLSFYRMLYRLLDVARLAGQLRVFKDGALSFGVRAGRFSDGQVERVYAGSTGNALADDATSAVYLLADGTLAVSQAGFPDPAATPYLPLATITTANGGYAHADIVDHRGRAIFRVLGA